MTPPIEAPTVDSPGELVLNRVAFHLQPEGVSYLDD